MYKRHRDRIEPPSKWSSHVLARDGYRCMLRLEGCLGVATEADHIVPLMDGGTHAYSNARAVCSACHRVKTNEEIRRGVNRWRRPPLEHPSDYQ